MHWFDEKLKELCEEAFEAGNAHGYSWDQGDYQTADFETWWGERKQEMGIRNIGALKGDDDQQPINQGEENGNKQENSSEEGNAGEESGSQEGGGEGSSEEDDG